MFSKTSSVRPILDLELKALKEQEELQTRLEKLRREAEQKEEADLQEELNRKARIAEKEIESAKASSSCDSSFRSISPVGTPDNNLTNVSEWMHKTEEAENLAPSMNVPLGYKQASVSAPVVTVRSTHGVQCFAQVMDLKTSLKPVLSTEAAVRYIGKDGTNTVKGAGSQRATAQPDVKLATSKPSITLSADQNRLQLTIGGIQSGAFQVPQVVNSQKQYLPS